MSLADFQECRLQAKKGRQVLAFYTMPEYEAWCERTNTQGWAIKYYKGLGTSDAKEAKEYFADIDDHRKTFVWNGEGPALAYVTPEAGAYEAVAVLVAPQQMCQQLWQILLT